MSSEPEFVPDDAGADDPGVDIDVSDAGQADDTAARMSGDTATATPPAKPKRKRGPNKSKPGLFTVVTEASMPTAEIIKLLVSRAEELLGKDAAAGMELQVNHGDGWIPLGDANGSIRFATKGSR